MFSAPSAEFVFRRVCSRGMGQRGTRHSQGGCYGICLNAYLPSLLPYFKPRFHELETHTLTSALTTPTVTADLLSCGSCHTVLLLLAVAPVALLRGLVGATAPAQLASLRTRSSLLV